MASSSVDDPQGRSSGAWFRRRRRSLVLAALGLLAIGALLLWVRLASATAR
jgi:hypothetical protein